jgi:hypothetical protein
MAKSNAMKRLERILSDEDFGPKLVRLNRADERHVLNLIEQNKGREARKEITRLDAARLEKGRARRGARRSVSKPQVIDIEKLRAQAYANMRRQLQGKPATLARNTGVMDRGDATFAATASADELRRKAGDRNNIREYEDLDIEVNVFWYK